MAKFHIVLYRATYLQRLSEVETAIKTDSSFKDPQLSSKTDRSLLFSSQTISLNTIRLTRTALKEIGMNGAEYMKL